MQEIPTGRSSRRRGRAAVVVTLAAAALAVGGVTAARANPGGPAAGNPPPSPTPSASGPSVRPVETPEPPGPEPTQTVSPPPLGEIPKITSRDRVAMPLDPVMTSSSDVDLLDTAGELKARDCMRSLGFTTWTVDPVSSPSDDKETDVLDYLPPADVSQSGYPSTLTDRSGGTSVGATSGSSLSEDALRAYTGAESTTASGAAVPEGGCEAEGDRQLKGAVSQMPVDPRFLAVQSKFAALRDDRMQRVFATWSSCMNGRGYHYDDPMSAQTDPRWGERTPDTPATAEEKATAAADAACQAESNLVGTYKALEIAYQKQALDENKAELTTALSIFNGWVANAKSIVAAN
ncbi:hypothetical protein [Sphaerisporangium fuscum]|uniref:hypothetical protein n=1 Tax=Sphaerisporangium fuscum TaxID=2835868 RepID=UPI001BDBC248|nr:hypothetical protein [Sphaerisporangium fuscum]